MCVEGGEDVRDTSGVRDGGFGAGLGGRQALGLKQRTQALGGGRCMPAREARKRGPRGSDVHKMHVHEMHVSEIHAL